EFQRGTVIGCHLCNKSSCEISSLLNIPQSTVSCIIRTWKRLGMTATQPQSGRPSKLTERGQRMLRRIVRRGRQLSAESIATDLQISSRTVCRELHGVGFHGRAAASKPYITKCNAKRRMQWCKARRHWTLDPTLWEQFGSGPFLFQHDCTPVHKARSIKTWMTESGVDELDWPAQIPDLNPTEHLWDELEQRLRARPSRPTSVCDLTNALLEEWSKIPINTLLNLVDSLPRRVEAVIAAKGGPTSY
ncbi:hypothetical protein M9458_056838, partial [Cirrhinus mrigala]